jgi:hypothetical protein
MAVIQRLFDSPSIAPKPVAKISKWHTLILRKDALIERAAKSDVVIAFSEFRDMIRPKNLKERAKDIIGIGKEKEELLNATLCSVDAYMKDLDSYLAEEKAPRIYSSMLAVELYAKAAEHLSRIGITRKNEIQINGFKEHLKNHSPKVKARLENLSEQEINELMEEFKIKGNGAPPSIVASMDYLKKGIRRKSINIGVSGFFSTLSGLSWGLMYVVGEHLDRLNRPLLRDTVVSIAGAFGFITSGLIVSAWNQWMQRRLLNRIYEERLGKLEEIKNSSELVEAQHESR